jgi:hypothetical protein
MTEFLAALRALVYMAGCVFVWGWLALQVRSIGGGWALPQGARAVGTVLMILGGLLVLSCVRNPMYLGALLVLAGFGLWHASLSMVLLALPALALAHLFVVFYEEPTLRRRFGMAYVAYLALVNRWVPKLPRRGMRPLLYATVGMLVSWGVPLSVGAQTPDDWAASARAIRRLPPSGFPQLPRVVQEALERRRCTIPQSFYPERPHNVVAGAFARLGQRDWAVLCSVDGRSTLLVFWAGRISPAPAELAPADDANFLQTIGNGQIGYSRAIDRVDPAWIRKQAETYGGPLPKRLDHDGIDDAFVEKASQVRYYEDGVWQELAGSD